TPKPKFAMAEDRSYSNRVHSPACVMVIVSPDETPPCGPPATQKKNSALVTVWLLLYSKVTTRFSPADKARPNVVVNTHGSLDVVLMVNSPSAADKSMLFKGAVKPSG